MEVLNFKSQKQMNDEEEKESLLELLRMIKKSVEDGDITSMILVATTKSDVTGRLGYSVSEENLMQLVGMLQAAVTHFTLEFIVDTK